MKAEFVPPSKNKAGSFSLIGDLEISEKYCVDVRERNNKNNIKQKYYRKSITMYNKVKKQHYPSTCIDNYPIL